MEKELEKELEMEEEMEEEKGEKEEEEEKEKEEEKGEKEKEIKMKEPTTTKTIQTSKKKTTIGALQKARLPQISWTALCNLAAFCNVAALCKVFATSLHRRTPVRSLLPPSLLPCFRLSLRVSLISFVAR